MNGIWAALVGGLGLACSAQPVAHSVAPSPPSPAPRQCEPLPRQVDDEPAPLTEALAVYEDRATAHPTDIRALFDLVRAYEQVEKWDHAASTAARLLQLEPRNARYQHRRGLNLVREAQAAGEVEWFQSAEEPLEMCIELDPRFAECYFLLGEVAWWQDDAEPAARRYRQAIELAPTRPLYYQRLAEVYAAFRQDRAAAAVLSEALKFLPAQGPHASARFPLLLSVADLTARSGDVKRALGYLAQADPLAETGPAPLSYELAAAYAKTDPELNGEIEQKVVTLMKRFHEGACRGDAAIRFKLQCVNASVWVMTYAP